nr:MAG TPA: minor capsid protein [Caudoviricetes sp.]
MGYTIPRSYIDNFSDGIEAISSAYKQQLEAALSGIDVTAPGALQQVGSILQMYCKGSTQSAVYLAKKFYMGLRAEMVDDDGFEGVEDTGYSGSRALAAANKALGQMHTDNQALVANYLQSYLGTQTKRASHRTIVANGMRDPRQPRFARIPQATRSYAAGCPFCQMLASRGFVYCTRGTASVHVHDDCRCVIVPSWDKSPMVEGYEPKDYWAGYEKYKAHDYSQPDRSIPHCSLEWQQANGFIES